MSDIVEIPRQTKYITFKKGNRVRGTKQVGVLHDGRALFMEMDRVGRIIGIEIL